MDLVGKIALVTGGASGLGEASAYTLSAAGATVVLLDLNAQALAQAATELSDKYYVCNVSDAAQTEQVIGAIVQDLGAIHICVNCAGIVSGERIVGRQGPMDLDDFNRVIQVNLLGTFNVMRLVAAQMMQQECVNDDGERGVIINTASVAAFEGQIGQAAYSASKGGVAAMTVPAAREFAQFGIRVMTIAPGIMSTPMMAGMPEKLQQNLHEAVPFPKRMGYPEEYAQLVRQIVENPYLNGSVIRLDGAIRLTAK